MVHYIYVFQLYHFGTHFITDTQHSESDLEAEKCREKLRNLVDQLLQSNHDMSRRLRMLEDTSESQSSLTRCFRNGRSPDEVDGGDANTIIPGRVVPDRSGGGEITSEAPAFRFDFEDDLETSRVYKRTQLY